MEEKNIIRGKIHGAKAQRAPAGDEQERGASGQMDSTKGQQQPEAENGQQNVQRGDGDLTVFAHGRGFMEGKIE